jgi:hypothetical protein
MPARSGIERTGPDPTHTEHTPMRADAGTRCFAHAGDHLTISGKVIGDTLGAMVLLGHDEAQPRQVSEVGAIQGH